MIAVKTGMFWVDRASVSQTMMLHITQQYTYPHPHEPNKVFCTLVILEHRLGIPSGDINKLQRIFPSIEISDKSLSQSVDSPISLTGLTLRPYQESALTEVMDYFNEGNTSFNLSGEPGSGKSVMLSAIITKLGVKTLIIAHLSMLTTQLKKEIEQFTDADVRILDKDQLELGDVNIATSQFISQRPELWYKIKKEIGLIAVDEAESIASETTLKILQRAHARYRIAVTATFTRSVDGRTPALQDMIGHKVISLFNEDLIKPTIITVDCTEHFNPPRSKKLYKRSLVKFFNDNQSIHKKVVTIVKASITKGRQVLIATDLGKFQDEYAEMLENIGINCGVMNSKTKTKDRERILKEFDDGKIKVLIGFGVLNAGLSIPKITTILRVSTPGNIEKLEQLIGRGRRDFPGKEGMWFIDLVFGGFSYASATRAQFYRKMRVKDGWSYFKTNWELFERKLI